MGERHISRNDLEEAVRRAVDGVGETVNERRVSLIAAAVIVGLGAVAVGYLLGRRIGEIRSTIVEVRRL